VAHGVVQARADGPDGDVQHVGDFFVGQFLFEPQFERVTQFGREIADGFAHGGEAVVLGSRFWRGFVPGLRDRQGIALAAVVPREHVAGDAEEPGAGHGDSRQLIRLANDLQEGFLQEIAGGGGIRTASGEVAIKLARMLSVQLLDCRWLGLHVRRIVSCILVVASRSRKVHGEGWICWPEPIMKLVLSDNRVVHARADRSQCHPKVM